MKNQLTVEAGYHDSDLVEVLVAIRHVPFEGAASIYVSPEELQETADRLRGFPRGRGDVREFLWGSLEQGTSLGGASLLFQCDGVGGHSKLCATLSSGDQRGEVPGHRVIVTLPVEAAGVDTFVSELLTVAATKRGIATLPSPQ